MSLRYAEGFHAERCVDRPVKRGTAESTFDHLLCRLLSSLTPMEDIKKWMKICLAQAVAIETNRGKSIEPQTNKVEK